MKKQITLLTLFFTCLPAFSSHVVCDGGAGYNRFGFWDPCPKWHVEEGPRPEAEYPIDANRVGQVERVRKNIDGSVTVWRHGSPNDERWQQVDENTWERTH